MVSRICHIWHRVRPSTSTAKYLQALSVLGWSHKGGGGRGGEHKYLVKQQVRKFLCFGVLFGDLALLTNTVVDLLTSSAPEDAPSRSSYCLVWIRQKE